VRNLEDAKAWVNFAQRDYDVAVHLSKTFHPLPVENICYGFQQTVEKALKAIIIYNTGDYPRTHDIGMLYRLCREYTDEIDLASSITRTLTRFATKSRYPDDVHDFTEADAELGFKYATQVLAQVGKILITKA